MRVAEALYNSGMALYNQQYYTEAVARFREANREQTLRYETASS